MSPRFERYQQLEYVVRDSKTTSTVGFDPIESEDVRSNTTIERNSTELYTDAENVSEIITGKAI